MDATIITLKRKTILSVIEYCLDNKIEFTVKEKSFGHDEFELKLMITDIKKALAFGYYARENKIDLPGMGDSPAPKATKATRTSKIADTAPAEEPKAETATEAETESETQESEENANAMLF